MLEIDWLIHYKCNYRCRYCFFEGYWDEVMQKDTVLDQDRLTEVFSKLSSERSELHLIISGGEPSLYPRFFEMLERLTEFCKVSFDTNFSWTDGQLDYFLKNIAPAGIRHIGLSYHPEFAAEDEFLSRAQRLTGYDFKVHMVTHPEMLGDLRRTADIFLSKGFRFVPQPFRGSYKGREYPASFSDSDEKLIRSVMAELIEKDRDFARGQLEPARSRERSCRAGMDYVRLDSDGTVYCCANDFTGAGDDSLNCLGNILSDDFRLNAEPMICRQDNCYCESRWIIKEQ